MVFHFEVFGSNTTQWWMISDVIHKVYVDLFLSKFKVGSLCHCLEYIKSQIK